MVGGGWGWWGGVRWGELEVVVVEGEWRDGVVGWGVSVARGDVCAVYRRGENTRLGESFLPVAQARPSVRSDRRERDDKGRTHAMLPWRLLLCLTKPNMGGKP